MSCQIRQTFLPHDSHTKFCGKSAESKQTIRSDQVTSDAIKFEPYRMCPSAFNTIAIGVLQITTRDMSHVSIHKFKNFEL